MIKLRTIEDVVNYQLCTGCGICATSEPNRFRMEDVPEFGMRPALKEGAVESTNEAIKLCPGRSLQHQYDRSDPHLVKSLEDCWGPVYGVWEGYAVDEEIRWKGSSGGAASALSLFGIERRGADSLIHIGSQAETPHLNRTVQSTTKEEVITHAGSRYAPASPCTELANISDSQKVVFVGKPCDVAAVRQWEKQSEKNRQKVEICIGFFCAGVPSTKGNIRLLNEVGIEDVETLTSLKYRGFGWPGYWRATSKDNKETSLTYEESWGFLQQHRQWRCYICPDHSGEFADVAVGDPWYRDVLKGESGKSLIVARTKKGLDYILQAAEAKYIHLETRDDTLLPRSQPNLIGARGALWGRLNILRLMGAPTPDYSGFSFFKFWLSSLSGKEKFSSIFGTAKRVFRKRLRHSVSPNTK